APAEGVAAPVALDDHDLAVGPRLLHQHAEIQTRRAAAEDRDLHPAMLPRRRSRPKVRSLAARGASSTSSRRLAARRVCSRRMTAPTATRDGLLLVAAFASGAAALTYEMLWTQLLALSLGSETVGVL